MEWFSIDRVKLIVSNLGLPILMLAVGIMMFVNNCRKMNQPTEETQLVEATLVSEIQALAPWHKHPKFTKKQLIMAEKVEPIGQGQYLSEEQCLLLAKIISSCRDKITQRIVVKSINSRQGTFQKQYWSSWEMQVDDQTEDLNKNWKIVVETALKQVGINEKIWDDCINHYFCYPTGHRIICKALEVSLVEARKQITCTDREQKLTAWRWLLVREAELENKMEAILLKNNLELYHTVKFMEYAKIEDGLYDEFNVYWPELLHIKQLTGTDEQTDKFENDLRSMLDQGDKICLGLDSRVQLWKLIDEVGPIVNAGETLIASTLCAILSVVARVVSKRYQRCMQTFVDYRCEVYCEMQSNRKEEATYRQVVKEITNAESKLREEALSFVLYKLRIKYTVYLQSMKLHAEDKQVGKLWLSMFEDDPDEFEGVFYSRETMLSVTQRLAEVRKRVHEAYQDRVEDIQDELALRESEEFDQLKLDREIDQRAYEHLIRRNNLVNDPKFRELFQSFQQ